MAHSRQYVMLMNSKRWRDLRNEWLSDHPECEQCKREGRVALAQCVHHVTPVESGRTDMECEHLAFSRGNLMSLCYACHAQVHKAERSHSKQQHHDRERERLERWVSRLRGESTEDPGGSFF